MVGYHQAELYCIRLAEELKRTLADELPSSQFTAIPRGGLIILGILSYVLGLKPSQLSGSGVGLAGPLVIVDDCCLSGSRFWHSLGQLDAKRIIFAHLLSPPTVRDAIINSEPRVEACLAAADLDEQNQGALENFPLIVKDISPKKSFGLGVIEPVAFAWSEPDRFWWDSNKADFSESWHYAPPQVCLEARLALDVPLSNLPSGCYSVPGEVVWRIDYDQVTLKNCTKDKTYNLKGVIALMWRALAAYGNVQDALEFVSQHCDIEFERLRRDFEVFSQDLLEKGLLVDNK